MIYVAAMFLLLVVPASIFSYWILYLRPRPPRVSTSTPNLITVFFENTSKGLSGKINGYGKRALISRQYHGKKPESGQFWRCSVVFQKPSYAVVEPIEEFQDQQPSVLAPS